MTTKESNKKGFARKLIEDIDENWFSFLSGVFANIPISLLFCFQSWGETYFSHSFFILQWVAFILSIGLLICAYKFTMMKININKDAQKLYEKWVVENGTPSVTKHENIKKDCVTQKMKNIITILIAFIVLVVLTAAAIGTLWWLYSKI